MGIKLNQKSIILTIPLSLCAFIGNYASLPLFYGIDLIFGSIAVMYAVMAVGRTSAVIVALLGSIYTYYLWGHPYAIIIFVIEALWVSFFWFRGYTRLAIIDAGYWLVLGIPLVFVFYTQFIGLNDSAAGLVGLKQAMNGVFNVIIASFIYIGIESIWKKRKKVKIQSLLFNVILLITLVAGAVPATMSSYQANVAFENKINNELKKISEQISNVLRKKDNQKINKEYSEYLSTFTWAKDVSFSLLHKNKVIYEYGKTKSNKSQLGSHVIVRKQGAIIWLPNEKLAVMKDWQLGRYINSKVISGISGIDKIVVEKKSTDVVSNVYELKIELFSILAALMLAAFLLATIISRWITGPLNILDKASHDLVAGISLGKEVELPDNFIYEFSSLTKTLLSMAERISSDYKDLNAEKENLEVMVGENTEELRRLSMVASRTTSSVIITNVNGEIEWTNAAFTHLTGYQLDYMIGKKPGDILQGAETDLETVERISDKINNKEKFSEEIVNYTRDGLPYWVHIDCDPIENDGEKIGFIAIESDITERKKAEEKLVSTTSELNAVLNAATEMSLITTDANGLITMFNSGAEKMLGYSADEMIGKQTPAIFHIASEVEVRSLELSEKLQKEVNGFDVFVTIPNTKGSETREWTYVKKDGEQLTVVLSVTTIASKDGGVLGYLGMAKDITEQKRLENLKNSFVSTVSHELRTPLTSIKGTLSLVNAGVVGEVPNKVNELLVIAEDNSQRLALLIDDLLDMDKIATGNMKFNFDRYVLMSLVEKSVVMNKSYADKYNVKLNIIDRCDDAEVYVDPDRLLQVMANIISNAAKFSKEHESVDINVNSSGEKIRVSIQDYGFGISEDFKKIIFSKFSQADASSTRNKGGTGLGLAISKELIKNMDGEMGFVSEKGKGSTFWYELPLVSNKK